jgi:hypothetical protein
VFLAWYTGRARTPAGEPDATAGSFLNDALAVGDGDAAGAAALGGAVQPVADCLDRAALEDRSGSFIIAAHHVKTARAARAEAAASGSCLPLAGTARFIASPVVDRFVRTNVVRAVDLLSGRGPGDRADEG